MFGKRGQKAVLSVVKCAIGVAFVVFCAGKSGVKAGSHSNDNFGRWRAQIREALFLPRTLPALEPKVWGSFEAMPGVVAERVTFATGAPSGEGMLVTAVVYRPEKVKGKLPGIVIVSGDGGDKFSWYAVYSGLLFARMGAEVVTYDPLGEGERNTARTSGMRLVDKVPETPAGMDAGRFREVWGQRLAGQMVEDLGQAVNLLRSRPEVDGRRIAVVGYGSGAFVAGLAGAVWSGKDEERVKAVVLDGGGIFDDASDGGKSLDTSERAYEAAAWRALLALGPDPDRRGAVVYALNAERGAMLVENGSQDTQVDVPHRGPEWFEQVRAKAMALGGAEKTMFTSRVDDGMGHRTAWLERPGVEWLEREIHFDDWKGFTGNDLGRTPVTKVSQWVRGSGGEFEGDAGREDREGGVMAVGQGIAGVRRKELMVMPAGDWEKEKGRLTYEGWLERLAGVR